MIETLVGILMGIALARLSYALGSRTEDRRGAFHSIAFIALLITFLAYHVHYRSTFSDYARLELLFIRLGLAATLGFCGYWIYLIVRDGEPRIPNIGRTAQSVFKYIAIGLALLVTMLLLYLEPSPLLSRMVKGLSAVKGYGLEVQFQGAPNSAISPKNDYSNKTQGEPTQSLDPARDSKELAKFFFAALAGNRERDMRLMRELTGEELAADESASSLISGVLVPAYGCLLQLERGGLDLTSLAEPLRSLNNQLREEMHAIERGISANPASLTLVAEAMVAFVKLLQESAGKYRAWFDHGLPRDDSDRNLCGELTTVTSEEAGRATRKALQKVDIRQGRLHVIGAAMALNDNDRLRALGLLDNWLLASIRATEQRETKAKGKKPETQESPTRLMPVAVSYCRTGSWPGATIRPATELSPPEVESLLLTCVNMVRARILQTRILQLYQLNFTPKLDALVEAYGNVVELLEGVWEFSLRRTKDNRPRSLALVDACHSEKAKDCPPGLANLKFAEVTHKNNFVYYCSLSRLANEKCAQRSEEYCVQILDKRNASQLTRGAQAAQLNPAVVRGSFLDSCASWRLKDVAEWFDDLHERPGALTRGVESDYLKPARDRLRSIANEIIDLRPKLEGLAEQERLERAAKAGIAEGLQSGASTASLLNELNGHRKNIMAAISRMEERLSQ